jgi:CHAD domain-containing protein
MRLSPAQPGPPADRSAVTSAQVESERKYEVDASLSVPDLAGLPAVATVQEPEELKLDATYFDTPDLRLATAGVTLRRRTGGTDAGWHLKLSRGDGDRDEIRRPLGTAKVTVPAELVSLVRAHVRDRRLRPVARLSTRRIVRRLVDSEGRVLAEVCDDHVTAEPLGDHQPPTSWREWEVELVDGDPELLKVVGDRLEAAGARPASGPSKLRRALADRLPASPSGDGGLSKRSSALDVVLAHLRGQVGELKAWDPRVRQDEYDSVHKMRVATRRLRSALATYRRVLDRSVTDPLRDELKWLAGVLGAARDAEVMRDRLLKVVAEEPPEFVLGPVARRIELDLGGRYREAHEAALAELDGTRYFRLLDRLDALLAEPPVGELASERADKALPGRVDRAWKRVRRFARLADAATTPEQRVAMLHEVRKAAKRARYAGESVAVVFGSDAKDFAKAFEDLQDILGEHQDSVVTRDLLRTMGVQAHLAGENGFTFGRLHALEQRRGEEAQAKYAEAWKVASDKALRRWLS